MPNLRLPFLLVSVFIAILGFTAPRSEDYCVVTFTNGERVFAFSWVDQMDVYDLQFIASAPLARPTRAVTFQAVPGSDLGNIRFDAFYNYLTVGGPIQQRRDRFFFTFPDQIRTQSTRAYAGPLSGWILDSTCFPDPQQRFLIYPSQNQIKVRQLNNADNPAGPSWTLFANSGGDIPIAFARTPEFDVAAEVKFNSMFGYFVSFNEVVNGRPQGDATTFRFLSPVINFSFGPKIQNKLSVAYKEYGRRPSGQEFTRNFYGFLNPTTYQPIGQFKPQGAAKDTPFAATESWNTTNILPNLEGVIFSRAGEGCLEVWGQELNPINGNRIGPPKGLLDCEEQRKLGIIGNLWDYRSYRLDVSF